MHSFEVHSNESVYRNSGCLWLEQVSNWDTMINQERVKISRISVQILIRKRLIDKSNNKGFHVHTHELLVRCRIFPHTYELLIICRNCEYGDKRLVIRRIHPCTYKLLVICRTCVHGDEWMVIQIISLITCKILIIHGYLKYFAHF